PTKQPPTGGDLNRRHTHIRRSTPHRLVATGTDPQGRINLVGRGTPPHLPVRGVSTTRADVRERDSQAGQYLTSSGLRQRRRRIVRPPRQFPIPKIAGPPS